MRVLAGLTAATVAATAGVLTAAPASAAVPVFPDNITIFPDRDFVSIDGFVGNAGKPITVEVVRGGTVIGSATGPEAGADVINAEEDGELGGPGFGGCPAAAVAQGPASPTNVKATDNGPPPP